MTKNLNINQVINIPKQYNQLFETTEQKSSPKMEGGTLWSEKTFVLFTDAFNPMSQNYRREPKAKLGDIQFQLHQSEGNN